VDLNGDGELDLVSGIYLLKGDVTPRAGHPQVAYGIGNGKFGESQSIKNKAGKLLLAPLATNKDPKRSESHLLCTTTTLGDLNNDGTVDMLVGGNRGNIYYIQGEKTPKGVVWSNSPVNLKDASGADLAVAGRKVGPHLVDWDKDGDLDILCGTASGAVHLYTNAGNKSKPVWSAPVELLGKAQVSWEQNLDKIKKVQRGTNSRVHAVDWNNDGKLDLLVGDRTTLVQRHKNLTDEQFEGFMDEYNRLTAEAQAMAVKGRKDLDAKKQAHRLYHQARQVKAKAYLSQDTGHIWLYLAK